MFIIKNAWRNIMRSKGRSILIGIIVMMIAFSACIGLCIRQSAETSRTTALNNMNITAEISPDREKAMEKSGGSGNVDLGKMREAMAPQLSLEELEKYKSAEAVKAGMIASSPDFKISGFSSGTVAGRSISALDTSVPI